MHDISNAHKTKMLKNLGCFLLINISSQVVFILLTNVKMPTIVGILTIMSRIQNVNSCSVELFIKKSLRVKMPMR